MAMGIQMNAVKNAIVNQIGAVNRATISPVKKTGIDARASTAIATGGI